VHQSVGQVACLVATTDRSIVWSCLLYLTTQDSAAAEPLSVQAATLHEISQVEYLEPPLESRLLLEDACLAGWIWSWLLPTPLTVLLPGSAHVAAAHVTTAHVTAALPQLHPKSS